MQSITKFKKRFRLLLCAIDIFSKYVWVIPLKDKKGATTFNAFEQILKKFNKKPNKTWIDKSIRFYNNCFEKWLQDKNIEMYSTHNEGNLMLLKDLLKCYRIKFTNT